MAKGKPQAKAPPVVRTQAKSTGLRRGAALAIVLMAYYLLIAIPFGPVVVGGMALSTSPDMIAAAGMISEAERQMDAGHFPLWNPTVFSGMPLFASLQYANFVYPPEYPVKALSYLFGPGNYRIWLFHFFLAALFTYLLARHLGAGRMASWIAGAAYGISPQLIVLADVGHGSKLMGMVWLPLIWLALDRLRLKPSAGRAAALGAVFAVEILSLHPQVAAYGAMLMAVYLLYHLGGAIKTGEVMGWLKTLGYWAGAMALSLAVSAVLWVSVLDYARFSIRGAAAGGMTGGGVSWDYATGWSFHPIESLTYLFPSFFGFAGGTYWGTVGAPDGTPFTQNPMFFGVTVVLLAALALTMLPKGRWGFPLTLGLIAWVLSFGRYLPILYAPLFYGLPLFNKFRAPVMGQVLLLLPAVILAALGLQALFDRIKTGEASDGHRRAWSYVAAAAGGLALLILTAGGLFEAVYRAIAAAVQPSANASALNAALQMAQTDAARSLAIIAVAALCTALALKRKFPAAVLFGILVILLVVDLFPVNRKLVNFVPESRRKELFQADRVISFLSREKDKFRVHPLDKSFPAIFWQRQLGLQANINPSNWLGYFGVEATTGYFGAKLSGYQKLMDVSGLDANPPYSWLVPFRNPALLDWLNVRYFLTTVPLPDIFEQIERSTGQKPVREAEAYQLLFMPQGLQPGSGAFIYKNPGELPRARLLGDFRVEADLDATLDLMTTGRWNPHREVLLNRPPSVAPRPGGVHDLRMALYQPWRVEIDVTTSEPKLLVLADNYYPSGWTATVNGNPAEILRADGVFRAVALTSGEHKVIFGFRPGWFYTGLYISSASAALLLLWLLFWGYRHWRVQPGRGGAA